MSTEALAKALTEAAEAVINRWHSPDWKDVRHTADFINALREALAAYRAVPESLGVPASPSGSSLKPFGHAAIPNAADGAPTLPAHPDARVFTWTASELRAIERYGQQCHEQGRQQGRAQAAKWQPIETAPKTQPGQGPRAIILGFAPDEEGYSPRSIEGAWNCHLARWASTLDPGWAESPQPTHWMPLPTPPAELGATKGDA